MLQQFTDRGPGEQRQVGGEQRDHADVGVQQRQAGRRRGDRASTGRLLPDDPHTRRHGVGRTDQHPRRRVADGGQHPVTHRPAADRKRGLVQPAHPSGGPTREHHCGVRPHPATVAVPRLAPVIMELSVDTPTTRAGNFVINPWGAAGA